MGTASVQDHLELIERDSYTIVESAFGADEADALLAELARLERELGIGFGPNTFEGQHTKRVYNLLAHGPRFEAIPLHPRVLPIVEGVLDSECLVSSLSSIAIHPGESAQPIHADDQILPLPKPHVATVCNSMWALTDFTEQNGATRIIPGSHKRDSSPVYGSQHASVPAEMPRGSCSRPRRATGCRARRARCRAARVGIAMNYCAGWVRQQENQQLGIPLETARRFSPRLRQLAGFGLYRGIIGHIDKRSPAELLGDAPGARVFDF